MIETPTTIQDIRDFVPAEGQDCSWQQRLLECPQPELMSDWVAQHGRTLWVKDKIAAIGGVQPLWPGVGELWFSFGEAAFQHPAITMRHLVFLAHYVEAHFKFHRLQVVVDMQDLRLRPLLERLGYREEGQHDSYYAPGHHYLMLAKVLL